MQKLQSLLSLIKKYLNQIKDMHKAEHHQENIWLIQSLENKDIRENIFQFAVKNDLSVLSMQKQEKSLEEVFKDLTGN